LKPVLGVDFGTTNSVAALRAPDGSVATLPLAGAEAVLRSVLCFWQDGGTRHAAGAAAVEAYLEDPFAARLLLSLKSYLAQPSFRETRIFGRSYTLESLIGMFLREALLPVRAAAEGARVVVGRPVRFVGEDDELGEARLRAAFALAGFPEVTVALEPAAAGHRFAAGLNAPATVLVADFGGGTSDFSVLRFEPAPRRVMPLGHSGLGIAGDAFDYRIIDRVVSPLLGKGDNYSVWGKPMPVPAGWYTSFARWHRLSLMRAPKVLNEIAEVARTAEHPEKLQALIRLIEEEAGYGLYQAVSAAKAALSRDEATVLEIDLAGFRVAAPITRTEFESWIAPELARIAAAVDAALDDAGLDAGAIDRVFLTGGTSLVPAVRRIFATRFGEERLLAGGEFVSVAEGLALMGD
jgi:hypothetical chaperone protein